MEDFKTRDFVKDFTEDERLFYLHEAGFNSREECLFGKKNRTGNSNPRMNIPDYLS